MAAALGSRTTFMTFEDQRGARIASGLLNITGIAGGSNTVAHGLPFAPRSVVLEKSEASALINVLSYDDTNIVFQSNGTGTTASFLYEYGR